MSFDGARGGKEWEREREILNALHSDRLVWMQGVQDFSLPPCAQSTWFVRQRALLIEKSKRCGYRVAGRRDLQMGLIQPPYHLFLNLFKHLDRFKAAPAQII